MTKINLKAIEERYEKATPAPQLDCYSHGGGRSYVLVPERILVADYYNEADRDFYWNARTDLPALAAWARHARAELLMCIDILEDEGHCADARRIRELIEELRDE